MSTTPNLGMTLLDANQAQPEVLVDAALTALDGAVAGLATPAASSITVAEAANLVLLLPTATGYTLPAAAAPRWWLLVNTSSGNVSINKPTGTGLNIRPGRAALGYWNGTNLLPFPTSFPADVEFADGKNIVCGTSTGSSFGSAAAEKVGMHGSKAAQSAAYTVTNPTTDRGLNVTGDTLAQVAQVLGTLIADLQLKGIIG